MRLPLIAGLSGLFSALLVRELFLVDLTQVHQGLWGILVFAVVELSVLFIPRTNRRICFETLSLLWQMFAKPVQDPS